MQRIYGYAFFTKDELEAHLKKLEEAKRRDHRRLGRELDLFSIADETGAGLILWHPKGGFIRMKIEDYWREAHLQGGYDIVFSPHIAKLDLWKTSGHTEYYRENMYSPIEIENVEYQLKPMNCPFHITIYRSHMRSYRELPLRYAELGTVYRFERSGVLHGLLRVRGFTQDDAHLFCRPDQLDDEILRVLDFVTMVLKTFGFERYDIYLSTRPAKSAGTDEQWETATSRPQGGAGQARPALRRGPGGGRVLRPQDRHQDQGRPRPRLAVLDHPGGLQQPEPLRPRVHRRGRQGPPAGDDPSRPAGQPGALLRRAHRALRGRVPALAGAGAGRGDLRWRSAPASTRARSPTSCARRASACTWTTAPRRSDYKIREAQVQKVPYMLVVGRSRKWTASSSSPCAIARPETWARWPPLDGRTEKIARLPAEREDERGGPAGRPRRRCLIDQRTVRINDRIRAKEVRVIDDDGSQLGIMPPAQALSIAEEKGLDLVEIAATATPPVCRIMNSGKFFYQQAKRESEARKHQRHIQVKEVKFRPKIDEHDFQFKKRNVERFLNDGNKVKSTVIFRGREMVHNEIGRRILNRLAAELTEIGTHRSAAASGRHDDGADPLAQEGARAGQAGQGEQGQEGKAGGRRVGAQGAARRPKEKKPRTPAVAVAGDSEKKP